MGFFDKEVKGSFDRLFDYNRDGVLDVNEQGFQLQYTLDSIDRDFHGDGDDLDDGFDSDFDSDF